MNAYLYQDADGDWWFSIWGANGEDIYTSDFIPTRERAVKKLETRLNKLARRR